PLDTAHSADMVSELSQRDMLCYDTANLTENENGNVDLNDGIDGYFAVDLSGTAFEETYNQTGENEEPLYAVIISNTEHLEDCEKLLRELVMP
ncbi:MAG: hypothetical protein K2N90_02070, partial [Lachnospiraceae bacterium]|nr:hypothetical protein [Lachnospiraceae bacterium]